MTLANHHNERAVDLLIGSRSREREISAEDRGWLESHLRDCAECNAQDASIDSVIGEMRSLPVLANSTLVRATQLRVRARARELHQQQENMRPLWVACAIAFAWAVVATPFLWQGLSWLGHANRLPDIVWQSGFFAMTLMPIAAVGTIGLANRFHRTAS